MQLEWNLRTINKKKIYSIIFGFFGAVGGVTYTAVKVGLQNKNLLSLLLFYITYRMYYKMFNKEGEKRYVYFLLSLVYGVMLVFGIQWDLESEVKFTIITMINIFL